MINRNSSGKTKENEQMLTKTPAINVVLRNVGKYLCINMRFEFLQVISLAIEIETLCEYWEVFPKQK